MALERILDIGIGSGGAYIAENTSPHELRIGIDIDRREMLGLQFNYPDVIPVVTDASRLPFRDDSFSKIEIVLPFGELMIPGLQRDHFALLKKHKDIYAQTHPHGWYPEFHRVLLPHGELVMYGDVWVDPKQVQRTSSGYFYLEQVQQLTVDEFKELGTTHSEFTLGRGKGKYIEEIKREWDDTLVKITLRSAKFL